MIEIIKPGFYWPETTVKILPHVLEHIEQCGRICYKSEANITEGSAEKFIRKIIKSGHESVLEHVSLTAIVVCSRSCSHQLVRHRIAAYSQESQRYCNYGNGNSLKIICPPSIGLGPGKYLAISSTNSIKQNHWLDCICRAYDEYLCELDNGVKPEDARYVLPNATKTELAVTFNVRQWRHVFRERALNTHAQWEIRSIFTDILNDIKIKLPALFGDL